MKTILITNANTFKGYHLCMKAIDLGYKVYAVVEKHFKHQLPINHADIIVLNNSLLDPKSLSEILKHLKSKLIHINRAIHVCSERFSGERVSCNYLQVQCLLEAFKTAEFFPQKFVLSSDVLAQGPLTKIDYQTAKRSKGPVSAFGRELLELEKLIKKQNEFSYLIFRTPFVYGAYDNKIEELVKLINNNIALYPIAYPTKFSALYIKDMLDVYFKTIESSIVNKTYSVSDGNQYTLESVYFVLKQLLNKKPVTVVVPAFLTYYFVKVARRFSKVMIPDQLDEFNNDWYCGIGELKNDTGFEPKYDLQRGIEDTVAWYRSEKWL